MSGISTLISALNFVEKGTQTENVRVISDNEVQAAVDGIMNLSKTGENVNADDVIVISDSDDEIEPTGMIRLPKRPTNFIRIQSCQTGDCEKKTTTTTDCQQQALDLTRKLRKIEPKRPPVVKPKRKTVNCLMPFAVVMPLKELTVRRHEPRSALYCLLRANKTGSVTSNRPLNTGNIWNNNVAPNVINPKQGPKFGRIMYAVRRMDVTRRMVAVRAPPTIPDKNPNPLKQ